MNKLQVHLDYDPLAKGFDSITLEEWFDQLSTADSLDLLTEPLPLQVLDDAFYPEDEPALILDMVSAKYQRLPRTLAALRRVIQKKLATLDGNLVIGDATISKPRKNKLFATVTAQFICSDGQTLSAQFHAPDKDPLIVNQNDTLIAYRWLLNKRDITHIVSAKQNGNTLTDISLDELAFKLAQLISGNSAKFIERQQQLKQAQAELQAADDELTALENQATELTTQIAEQQQKHQDLEEENQTLTAQRDELKKLLEEMLSEIEAAKAEADEKRQQEQQQPQTTTSEITAANDGDNTSADENDEEQRLVKILEDILEGKYDHLGSFGIFDTLEPPADRLIEMGLGEKYDELIGNVAEYYARKDAEEHPL
ncbi:hypothetical protein [Spartinivicinus marinus]|uniref:defense against restriction DarA-related protein n=1 Tax=Spartinivicinus marinus TaxID=2994442 RepID=UPI00225B44FE|nr:hypothetical protein [Spartinivicinus marinus]MCX4030378.1 hypothetical protein [Spartinivicinus marinus]MCX4030454.1 hypothetical protein [Spartinivicinus marinus]